MKIRGRAFVVAVVLSITRLIETRAANASVAHADRRRETDRQVVALDRDSMHRAARRVRSRRGSFRFAAVWSHRIDRWARSRTRRCGAVERASDDCIRLLSGIAERREWLRVEISWLAWMWWTELDPVCTAPESVRFCSPMRFVLDHADPEYGRLDCLADHQRAAARAQAANALRIARTRFLAGEQTARLMEYLAAPDGEAFASLGAPDTHCGEVDPVDEPVRSPGALTVERSTLVSPELAP